VKYYNILIVDDEPENHIIADEAFNIESNNNYRLHHVNNGLECLEHVKNNIPDLILLDIMMPEMGGIEVAKKIRENPEYANVIIIFVSALTHPKEQLIGYEVGGDDYVGKPFDFDVLTAKVSLALLKKDKHNELNKQQDKDNAVSSSVDISEIINDFALKSYNIESVSELLNEFLSILFNKTSTLGMAYINDKNEKNNFYTWHKEKPSEVEQFILKEKYNKNKPFSVMGLRAQIQFPQLSILILNMPEENKQIYSQCKSLLLQMSEIINKRMTMLLSLNEIDNILETSNKLLEKSIQSLEECDSHQAQIFDDLLKDHISMAKTHNLDSSDYSPVNTLIEEARDKSNKLGNTREKTINLLTTLIYQLKSCSSKNNQ